MTCKKCICDDETVRVTEYFGSFSVALCCDCTNIWVAHYLATKDFEEWYRLDTEFEIRQKVVIDNYSEELLKTFLDLGIEYNKMRVRLQKLAIRYFDSEN